MTDETGAERGEGRTIRQAMEVSAPRGRVWEAWTDPGEIVGWFVDRAAGSVEEGGVFTWFWDKYGIEVPNQVVTVEPGERLVLDAPWGPGRSTRLEVILEAEGGRTRVRVVHSGFGEGADWDDEYEGSDSGWRMALGLLKHYVEAHFGEPRSQFLVQRQVGHDGSAIPPLYHTSTGLDRWLTHGSEVEKEGGEVRLDLRDGGALTGRVLARTESEILFSWKEEEGALELKTYGTPQGRMVAIRGSGWSRPEGWDGEMEARFEPVLERLVEALGDS